MAVLQKLEKIYNLLLNGPVKVLGTVSGTIHGTASAADYDYNGNKISTYYQEKLVSGTNIKTINGQSLLTSKDISVSSVITVELSPKKSGESVGFLKCGGGALATLNLFKYSGTGTDYNAEFLNIFDNYIVLRVRAGNYCFSVSNLIISSTDEGTKNVYSYEVCGLRTVNPDGLRYDFDTLIFDCIAK